MDFQLWTDALTKPKEVFSAQKSKGSVGESAKNWAITGFVYGILIALSSQLIGNLLVPATGFNIVGLITSAVSSAIAFPIAMLVGHFILGLIAKAFGGKGEWSQHYFLMSLVAVPIYVLMGVLNLVPVVGGLIGSLLGLYMLYLLTLSLMETHGLSMGKAFLVWVIPFALLMLIVFLVIGVAGLAILGMAAANAPK